MFGRAARHMGASATSLSSMASVSSAAPALGLFVAVAGITTATVTYFVDTRVNKEVALVREEFAKLKAGTEGLKVEVDAKCAGLASGVDAKCAGLASGVDAKCAGLALGLTKEVDAKNAGLVREVEARMAGVVAIAASKAEAETLRVLKEYKVRASWLAHGAGRARARARHGSHCLCATLPINTSAPF